MKNLRNNKITYDQWLKIVSTIKNSDVTKVENKFNGDVLNIFETKRDNNTRYSVYDRQNRDHVPGLDFVIDDNADTGLLTVYTHEEQVEAPITFEEGKQIGNNLFNEYGAQMAEEIIYEWLDTENDARH